MLLLHSFSVYRNLKMALLVSKLRYQLCGRNYGTYIKKKYFLQLKRVLIQTVATITVRLKDTFAPIAIRVYSIPTSAENLRKIMSISNCHSFTIVIALSAFVYMHLFLFIVGIIRYKSDVNIIVIVLSYECIYAAH